MINIAFTGWWNDFKIKQNFITRILEDKIDYKVVDLTSGYKDVDYLFCSLFDDDYLKFDCPRVFFTGENIVPDFNLFDYAIGFEKLDYGDRYLRFPLYVLYVLESAESLYTSCTFKSDAFDRQFCSYVVSNHHVADGYREKLFDELSKYRTVASGGRYRNNIGEPNGVVDKSEFLKKYKFNLACENVSHRGYVTEKIVDAFVSHTVPIYYGDPCIYEYFNPKAFINCNEFNGYSELVDYVKKVDTNMELYMDMLNQPKIVNDKYYIKSMKDELDRFILNIVSQKKECAYRRTLSGWTKMYEDKVKLSKKINNSIAYHCYYKLRHLGKP